MILAVRVFELLLGLLDDLGLLEGRLVTRGELFAEFPEGTKPLPLPGVTLRRISLEGVMFLVPVEIGEATESGTFPGNMFRVILLGIKTNS